MSIELSSDGSYTLFNINYQETYHSLRDGAIKETLFKHIFPAFEYANFTEKIRVLDICFGLGYNSFFTLRHFIFRKYSQTLEIYSPEKDALLLKDLLHFSYPKEIHTLDGIELVEILKAINEKRRYQKDRWSLECFIGDARQYLKNFEDQFFDIVYQDAFSFSKNPELWSEEFFTLLYAKLNEYGVVTTYSQSSTVRDNAKKAGFYIYELDQEHTRNSRIFSKKEINCKNLKKK